MRHLLFTLLVLLLAATAALAQGYSISGAALDTEAGITLPGAHVTLLRLTDSVRQETVTDDVGRFLFERVRPARYELTITYVGYEPVVRAVEVRNQNVDLGALVLAQASQQLQQVEVKDKAIMATQKGDTTQFNAAAFRTNPDANAEDLIRKMPGVTVENGQVQAQGEAVREVLVDGKPFFGNDPNAALRNLPAEIIEQVQVFDQQSEQSRFTGVNDGQTTKTINIITKGNARNGQFGKIFAGAGQDEKDFRYAAGGNVNIFSGDSRISIIGLSNNINQQNFAADDLLGVTGGQGRGGRGGGGGPGGGGWGRGDAGNFLVPQQNGIAQTHALGINYSDQWGKKINVTGSYFFNRGNNDAIQELNRLFVTGSDFDQTYRETTTTNNLNTNHRVNMRLDYTIDERNSILFRPRLSIQQNDGAQYTFGQNTAGSNPLNSTDYAFNSNLTGVDFSGDLLYRHRFAKQGRTFSLNISNGLKPQNGESNLLSENIFYNGQTVVDTLDQFSNLNVDAWSAGANATYTEPVGKKGMIEFRYEANYEYNDSDKRTFDFSPESEDYDQLNTPLSSTFNNYYLTQRAGTGYMLRGEKFTLNARVNYQWAELNGEQIFPYADEINRSFKNLLPGAFLRYDFSRQSNLRAGYRTSTSPPTITQLQDVVDNRNPLRLTAGNPNLAQSYDHRLFARYSFTNTKKSSMFFTFFNFNYTSNYVGSSTLIARQDTLIREGVLLPRGGQFVQSVNLDGAWSIRSFFTYGMPVGLLKSNLNFNVSANYSRQPGLINQQLNLAHNTALGLGLTLSSNISDKVDFTLSSRSNINRVRNSLSTNLNNEFFTQNTELAGNLIFLGGFVFRSELMHQLNTGLSEGFNLNYWLWNLSLGRKFLKGDRGELRLIVFDVLGQNTSIQRNVTEAYVEDVLNTVLQRYALLSFTYNLRNFGKPSSNADAPRRPDFGPGMWPRN